MDETDLLFETGRKTSDVQECEFGENNTETPQRIVSPYGNDTETGPLITIVGTSDVPLLRLDGNKILIANISVHGNKPDTEDIKVAKVGFKSSKDLIKGMALCAALTVIRISQSDCKDREKVKEDLEKEFRNAMEHLEAS